MGYFRDRLRQVPERSLAAAQAARTRETGRETVRRWGASDGRGSARAWLRAHRRPT